MTSLRITLLDQMGIGPSPTYQLDLIITPADVGTTFTINAATDPDFAAFQQIVTNGTSDFFGYSMDDLPNGGGSGTGWDEANLFAAGTHSFGPGSFTSIGTLSGPDFAGYNISGVTIRIDSFDLTSGGGFHSDDLRATATIIATPVPEPSAIVAALMTTGFIGWHATRFRRRQNGR